MILLPHQPRPSTLLCALSPLGLVLLLAPLSMTLCAACGAAATKTVPAGTTTTITPDTRTTVSVAHETSSPPNATCTAFCERLATCWYAMPNASPTLSKDEVVAQCHTDQDGCQELTTEAHCCGAIADCQDFVKCYEKSRNQLSGCKDVGPTRSGAVTDHAGSSPP